MSGYGDISLDVDILNSGRGTFDKGQSKEILRLSVWMLIFEHCYLIFVENSNIVINLL